MNFKLWLENTNIILDMSEFDSKFKKTYEDELAKELTEFQRLHANQVDIRDIASKLSVYPYYQNLMRSVISGAYLPTVQDKWRAWLKMQGRNVNPEVKKAYKDLVDFSNQKTGGSEEEIKSRLYDKFNELHKKSKLNINFIKSNIENVIKNIPWNDSIVTIIAGEPTAENPAAGAVVKVGIIPFHVYIEDGKLEVEDESVLQGNDDFDELEVTDEKSKIDYFNLVQEIRNPGFHAKRGKNVVMYTARPVEDREFYEKNQIIPGSVFMTNKFDHAEGLANDLSSGKSRDIWKVVIDSKNLLRTLSGNVEYYMTTKDTPVRMTLIQVGGT